MLCPAVPKLSVASGRGAASRQNEISAQVCDDHLLGQRSLKQGQNGEEHQSFHVEALLYVCARQELQCD